MIRCGLYFVILAAVFSPLFAQEQATAPRWHALVEQLVAMGGTTNTDGARKYFDDNLGDTYRANREDEHDIPAARRVVPARIPTSDYDALYEKAGDVIDARHREVGFEFLATSFLALMYRESGFKQTAPEHLTIDVTAAVNPNNPLNLGRSQRTSCGPIANEDRSAVRLEVASQLSVNVHAMVKHPSVIIPNPHELISWVYNVILHENMHIYLDVILLGQLLAEKGASFSTVTGNDEEVDEALALYRSACNALNGISESAGLKKLEEAFVQLYTARAINLTGVSFDFRSAPDPSLGASFRSSVDSAVVNARGFFADAHYADMGRWKQGLRILEDMMKIVWTDLPDPQPTDAPSYLTASSNTLETFSAMLMRLSGITLR